MWQLVAQARGEKRPAKIQLRSDVLEFEKGISLAVADRAPGGPDCGSLLNRYRDNGVRSHASGPGPSGGICATEVQETNESGTDPTQIPRYARDLVLSRCHKDRPDVDRDVSQPGDHGIDLRVRHSIPIEQTFGAVVVAGRLDHQQLRRERLDGFTRGIHIHAKAAIRGGHDAAFLAEPVPLHRGPASVRLVDAESHA